MTRVCLVGDPTVNLRYELLSRETSRHALSTYTLERPFENTLAVRTVSVGAAISLLNDLQWYLTRFVEEVFVLEPSVDTEEWLSRQLAEQLRNGAVEPETTDEFCKIYGLEPVDTTDAGSNDGSLSESESDASSPSKRLVEPLYVRRTDDALPEYDLREVEETLVVRLAESEFSN